MTHPPDSAEMIPVMAPKETHSGAVRGGESQAHWELKRLALVWAQARKFRIAAAEVSLPAQRYRLDVAACQMEHPGKATAARAASLIRATVIFECKASREDY